MNVFVTGATGFIGRAVILRLLRDGHRVSAWVRSEGEARSQLGAEVELVPVQGGDPALDRAISRADAVVNLAGAPIAVRWTRARKRALVESRVDLTARLVEAIRRSKKRPGVLVSGSAIGFYGSHGDETLDESASAGTDFLADLCERWEAAAVAAEPLGVRVARIRTGIVLGPEGGALDKMLPIFRIGAGGRLGSGRQYMSWIHLRDLVEMIATALSDSRWSGVFNGVAPTAVTNRAFTRALGVALRRPAIAPAPGFAIRLAMGEASTILLDGQRVYPRRALDLGFQFHFDTVDRALGAIVTSQGASIERVRDTSPAPLPDSAYLHRRRPTHLLRQQTRIDAPLETVFAFFSSAENLGLLTPAAMRFRITGRAAEITRGAEIDYSIRVGPAPLRWKTVIERWEKNRLFVDSQEKGPYRSWWHEHHFRRDGAATVMEDRVYFAVPLGPLGRVVNRLFVQDQLRRVFNYRAEAIALRFGSTTHSSARLDAA